MTFQIKVTKFQIVLFIIFGLHSYWIAAQDVNQIDKSDSNKTHWINCTINNTIYYDNDCFSWFENFLLSLSLGVVLLIVLFCCCFWYCCCALCRIICCSERPREVIYRTYIHPTTAYTRIP